MGGSLGIAVRQSESLPRFLSNCSRIDRGANSCYWHQRKKRADYWKGPDKTMKIVPLAEVKANLSNFVEIARSGPVVITKNGRAAAVLLAVTDEDELERLLLAHSPKMKRILRKSAKSIRAGRGI